MKNYIIFVLATFGGILALGLTVNTIKNRTGSQPCWVQVEEGLVPCTPTEEPTTSTEYLHTKGGGVQIDTKSTGFSSTLQKENQGSGNTR
jgi:hypothetical protein